MLASIDRLKNDYEKANTLLATAEHAGMEVSQPLFELNDAKTALIKARAAIHGFDQATTRQRSCAWAKSRRKGA